MARIPLPARDDLHPDLQSRWDRTAQRGSVLNIQRLFFAAPEIRLDALGVWSASGLDPRRREIVILHAAFRKESRYEWHQHVRIARDAGLSTELINATRDWQASKLFTDEERALLAYVDALADGKVTDETFNAMADGRSLAEAIAVTFLVTLYFQLAAIMATFQLETETPFVGWEVKGA